MTLIRSISGIRGTIGGKVGEGLCPFEVLRYSLAYGWWINKKNNTERSVHEKQIIVVGRDARVSGEIISNFVTGALVLLGFDVINIGLATTPTVEMAVTAEKASGGIIITASHNPESWNALKLLNARGEFISDDDGKKIQLIKENLEEDLNFPGIQKLGRIDDKKDFSEYHIKSVLEMDFVDIELIRSRNFKIVIDCVNSVGGIIIPALLRELGVKEIVELYCKPSGRFPHNPEPLEKHLTELKDTVIKEEADLGFAVDPDVDRLAIVSEDGSFFGEEYTLVAVADHILQHKKGNTVSNLSSTRALKDITLLHGGKYFASAVGEVNVVDSMKRNDAVIGGEGNGGVIFPGLHYGRDSLVGIALFLSYLAKRGKECSELRKAFPQYEMFKSKIALDAETDINKVLKSIADKYKNENITTIDGVKIDYENSWIHLRQSNTEPIVRIYAEAKKIETARDLTTKFVSEIKYFQDK